MNGAAKSVAHVDVRGLRGLMQWGGAAVALCGALGSSPVLAGELLKTGADAYRDAGARHLYGKHASQIFKGMLPPILYAVAVVETEVDEEGRVVSAVVTREPAFAKEVGPWIVGLIHLASPFPKPGARIRFQEVWLVDESYTFQLHTLSEGQR